LKSLAAILTAVNEPLELREIEWAPLQYGQVLVRVIASGICGAQLSEIRGEKGDMFPRLLGHEASVEIVETGPGVMSVKDGDKAVAHWRQGAGVESSFPNWRQSPRDCHTAGRITTFSQYSVLSDNRLTTVPKDTPDELAALLGCGLSTALGTIEHEAKLLLGESVLIIGCGGLGLNLILASKIRGASAICGSDLTSEKRSMARSMGATHVDGDGSGIPINFDVVIDTSGDSNAISWGISCLAPSGRMILVGQPKPRENVMLTNARHLFDGSGKTIMATQGGRFSPAQDIPRYIAAYRAGRIDLTGIVSHRIPLSRINEGLDLVRQGMAGRVMIDCQNDQ